MDKYSLKSLGLTFSLCLMVVGCTGNNSASHNEEAYLEMDLTELQGELSAEDPETIALNLFALSEPLEGNFSQEIEVIEQEGFKRTLLLTQTNLPDDSIQGKRYQLKFEFDQSTGQWNLVKAGSQQSCSRGEHSGHWTVETCP
ncbi:hypothetical protein [Crocosphaera sp. Alani8]|uniref:hypothetical protein n=1 Tax=Crocosphaera sp. Alani8 TaxID=3038952 RepID=UPI00313C176A